MATQKHQVRLIREFKDYKEKWFARWRFLYRLKLGKKMDLAPIQARIINVDSDRMSPAQSQRYVPRKNYVRNVLLPQLGQMGLQPKIINGFIPEDLTEHQNAKSVDGKNFMWGRDREGNLAAPYQICLVLGHMKIWEEAVKFGRPVLVLEDDAFLEKRDIKIVARYLFEYQFLSFRESNNTLLYLQSTCPWRPGKSPKSYPPSFLAKINRWFFQVSPGWQDVSGTAAYLVTPETCRTLLSHFSGSPLWNIDGMFDDLKRDGALRIYIPKKYKRNFKLHPELA